MNATRNPLRKKKSKVKIRRAEDKDIPQINDLLTQVLNIHAQQRPDIFVPNTTKYTNEELSRILHDDNTPVFAAVDDNDVLIGYAFCILQKRLHANNMTDIKTLFIDDLCVDEKCRGQHIGESLFQYVKNYAKEIGCYHVTLNVWSKNTNAIRFYEKMGLTPMETTLEVIL